MSKGKKEKLADVFGVKREVILDRLEKVSSVLVEVSKRLDRKDYEKKDIEYGLKHLILAERQIELLEKQYKGENVKEVEKSISELKPVLEKILEKKPEKSIEVNNLKEVIEKLENVKGSFTIEKKPKWYAPFTDSKIVKAIGDILRVEVINDKKKPVPVQLLDKFGNPIEKFGGGNLGASTVNKIKIQDGDSEILLDVGLDSSKNAAFVQSESLAQAMSVTNALDITGYDLNAAPFNQSTNVSTDYILDRIELNFSTAESKTVTITLPDGTKLYEDTNTKQHIAIMEIGTGFNGSENIQVEVTQFGSAGTMDCIVAIKQGGGAVSAGASIPAGSETIGGVKSVDDYYTEVVKGNIAGHSMIHKFGAALLTTTLAPITNSGFYRVPTTATALEFVSDSTDDDIVGTGAQKITITGLDSNWEEVSQTIETDGTTPVAIPTSLTRVYRWYVSQSGSYATQTVGSHAGVLTIRESGGGDTWSEIPITPFPIGQSQIAVYTVPAGKTAYLLSKNIFVDTTKTADIYFYQRPLANDVTTPYTGTMRLIEREVGVQGGYDLRTKAPKGPFVGPCDLGFMGNVSVGTADASAEFELLVVDN
jgi:hypothetical protein